MKLNSLKLRIITEHTADVSYSSIRASTSHQGLITCRRLGSVPRLRGTRSGVWRGVPASLSRLVLLLWGPGVENHCVRLFPEGRKHRIVLPTSSPWQSAQHIITSQ